ncbi:D-sedoheptulose-7-phosphate isomerase [Methylobacterium oryzihabitans]|nr:SIS domain-containing protein [Methylobacterium oryzihabitans]
MPKAERMSAVQDGPHEPATGFASSYILKVAACLGRIDAAAIDAAVAAIHRTWVGGGDIIAFGNGGSAITAQHFITDWNKGVFSATGRSFRGRTLIDNLGVVTAWSNDVSYSDVFSEQLRNLARPADLVVAISGSGNSENVVRAVAYANAIGCTTIGLCGYSGGRLKGMVQYPVWVPMEDMQVVEDVHAMFGHIVMQALSRSVSDAGAARHARAGGDPVALRRTGTGG